MYIFGKGMLRVFFASMCFIIGVNEMNGDCIFIQLGYIQTFVNSHGTRLETRQLQPNEIL